MNVSVYTLDSCPQCNATTRWLTKHHVDSSEIDFRTDRLMAAHAHDKGYKQAPIVRVTSPYGGTLAEWCGFRPDLLKQMLG